MLGASIVFSCIGVMGMRARVRPTLSTLTGLALIVAGFLVFVGAYFLLPLFITGGLTCGDVCNSPKSVTISELLLRALSLFALEPIPNTLFLALLSLPLLGAVVGVGYSLAYRVRARRAVAVWSTGALVAGTVALFPLMVPLFAILGHPETGYLGMLLGYGLLWAGNRLLLRTPRQLPMAA